MKKLDKTTSKRQSRILLLKGVSCIYFIFLRAITGQKQSKLQSREVSSFFAKVNRRRAAC